MGALGCESIVASIPPPGGSGALSCPSSEDFPGRGTLLPDAGQPSLVGDYVFVPVTRPEGPAMAVLRLGQGTVELIGDAEGLADPRDDRQPWLHVHGNVYARLHGSVIEVIDAADVLAPARSEVVLPSAASNWSKGTLGRTGTRVFACVALDGVDDINLVSIELADPAAPGEPVVVPSAACSDLEVDESTTSGSLWTDRFAIAPDFLSTGLSVFALDENGAAILDQTFTDLDFGMNGFVIDESVIAAFTADGNDVQLVYPASPAEPPLVIPVPGLFSSIADQVGYWQDQSDGLQVARVDLRRETAGALLSPIILEPNPLFPEWPESNVWQMRDGHRFVGVGVSFGDVYVADLMAGGSYEPLVLVDGNGNPICPPPLPEDEDEFD
jgi:hypothetical protein